MPWRFKMAHAVDAARRWPSPAGTSLRVHPSGRGQTAMPGERRRWGDDEPRPDSAANHPGQTRDHATIGVGEIGACRGSLQDCDLVTERDPH